MSACEIYACLVGDKSAVDVLLGEFELDLCRNVALMRRGSDMLSISWAYKQKDHTISSVHFGTE